MNMKEITGMSIVLIVMLFGASGITGGLCYPYLINEWLMYYDKEPVVMFWHGFVLGILPPSAAFAVFGSIATWIAMLFI